LDGVPASSRTNAAVTFQDLIYDCVIGANFWAGRSMTFDIAHKTLIVSAK
jgi:hypothetical protein